MTFERRNTARFGRVLIAAATAVLVATGTSACGNSTSDTESTEPPPPGVVAVKNMRFTPATITIAAGQTVTWEFDDGGKPHNVQGAVPADAIIHSPILRENTYTVAFDTPGEYQYSCTLHPEMTGTVIVR